MRPRLGSELEGMGVRIVRETLDGTDPSDATTTLQAGGGIDFDLIDMVYTHSIY